MTTDIDDLVAKHRDNIHTAPHHLKQQWHAAIDEAAALERGREVEMPGNRQPGAFFWGAAVSIALAAGVAIGVLISGNERDTTLPNIVQAAGDATVIPASLTRGLQHHLRASREQLANLDTDSDRTLLVMQIIEQNRLYEAVADNNNVPNLARVLRAFEPILLQLAATDIAPQDAEELRAQLSFELKVMLTKLAAESSDTSQTT